MQPGTTMCLSARMSSMMPDGYLLCVLSQFTGEFLVSLTGRIPELCLREKIAEGKKMLSLNSNCIFCDIFRTEAWREANWDRALFLGGYHTWQGLICWSMVLRRVLKGPSTPVAGKGSSHHPSVAMHIFPYRVTVQSPPAASSKHFPRPQQII